MAEMSYKQFRRRMIKNGLIALLLSVFFAFMFWTEVLPVWKSIWLSFFISTLAMSLTCFALYGRIR